MLIKSTPFTALIVSAVLVGGNFVQAQAPIVDASVPGGNSSQQYATEPRTEVSAVNSGNDISSSAQGELLYQLQLLQQEVMQLRGLVEEQSYQLKQLKGQNMERYIDLDRRIGELGSMPKVSQSDSEPNSKGSQYTPAKAAKVAAPVKAMSGEQEAYDAAYSLVRNRRFDDALNAFKQLLVDFPDSKYTPNSYYWVGELYQVVTPQDLEAARQAFTQLLERYPDHAKVPDAIYKLGKVHFLKGNREKSKEYLERVIANYSSGSNSSTADKARQFLNTNF